MLRSTGFVVVATLVVASSVQAYDPPPGGPRTDFLGALSTCNQYVKGNKGPGDVYEGDYQDYVEKRDKALAADPQLKEWDKPSLGIMPKELFPKCEKLMSDYAAGVDAEKRPTLHTSCKTNVEGRLNSIINQYYPEFEKNGATRSGMAWFARKDFEAARWYLFKGNEGWHSSGGGCAMNDHFKKAAQPLKDLLAKAEPLVKKIEAAKGVRFERVDFKNNANSIIFVDLQTGKPVAKADNY